MNTGQMHAWVVVAAVYDPPLYGVVERCASCGTERLREMAAAYGTPPADTGSWAIPSFRADANARAAAPCPRFAARVVQGGGVGGGPGGGAHG